MAGRDIRQRVSLPTEESSNNHSKSNSSSREKQKQSLLFSGSTSTTCTSALSSAAAPGTISESNPNYSNNNSGDCKSHGHGTWNSKSRKRGRAKNEQRNSSSPSSLILVAMHILKRMGQHIVSSAAAVLLIFKAKAALCCHQRGWSFKVLVTVTVVSLTIFAHYFLVSVLGWYIHPPLHSRSAEDGRIRRRWRGTRSNRITQQDAAVRIPILLPLPGGKTTTTTTTMNYLLRTASASTSTLKQAALLPPHSMIVEALSSTRRSLHHKLQGHHPLSNDPETPAGGSTQPDYGALDLIFPKNSHPHKKEYSYSSHSQSGMITMPRDIHYPFVEGAAFVVEEDTPDWIVVDYKLRLDDDFKRGRRVGLYNFNRARPDHHGDNHNNNKNDKTKNHCKRPAWYRDYYPNCNTFHETQMLEHDVHSLGHGYYKSAFTMLDNMDAASASLHLETTSSTNTSTFEDAADDAKTTTQGNHKHENKNTVVVLKALRTKHSNFTADIMEVDRLESLILERLSSSPRIMDIYGACSTSILMEYAPVEIIDDVLWDGGEGGITRHEVQQCEAEAKAASAPESVSEALPSSPDTRIHVVPPPCQGNDLTPREKLKLALEMARAVADLHGFQDGGIIHLDIKLEQFLATDANWSSIKLNDFNKADIMLYDDRGTHGNVNANGDGEHGYCHFRNKLLGIHRAPEENDGAWIDEQSDVYCLGTLFLAILTGMWSYYDTEEPVLPDDDVSMEDTDRFGVPQLPPMGEKWRQRAVTSASIEEQALIKAIDLCLVEDPKQRPTVFAIVELLHKAMAMATTSE
jgi:hypothetical protein